MQIFYNNKEVKSFEFLSKSIIIGNSSFSYSKNLTSVSFPNADHITFDYLSMSSIPDEMKIFVKRESQLDGSGLEDCMNKISYIEEKVKISKEIPNDTDNDEPKDSIDNTQEKSADDESKYEKNKSLYKLKASDNNELDYFIIFYILYIFMQSFLISCFCINR